MHTSGTLTVTVTQPPKQTFWACITRGAYAHLRHPNRHCHPTPQPLADFLGVVDLVQMKAIIWNDESLGAKFEV